MAQELPNKSVIYERQLDVNFTDLIQSMPGGENLRRCIQCGTCSATCPFSHVMDYTPRKIIYLIREGFKEEVMSSFTPWLCASCFSCRVHCPKEIKITDLMYLIKREAIKNNHYPPKTPIVSLTKESVKMIHKNGRISEGYLMGIVLLKVSFLKLLRMSGLGLKMLLTGRFPLIPEKIKRHGDLKKILAFSNKK